VQQCPPTTPGPLRRTAPAAELTFQYGDLMPQSEDFRILGRSPIGSSRSTANTFDTVR
jgi:hypothetical protein